MQENEKFRDTENSTIINKFHRRSLSFKSIRSFSSQKSTESGVDNSGVIDIKEIDEIEGDPFLKVLSSKVTASRLPEAVVESDSLCDTEDEGQSEGSCSNDTDEESWADELGGQVLKPTPLGSFPSKLEYGSDGSPNDENSCETGIRRQPSRWTKPKVSVLILVVLAVISGLAALAGISIGISLIPQNLPNLGHINSQGHMSSTTLLNRWASDFQFPNNPARSPTPRGKERANRGNDPVVRSSLMPPSTTILSTTPPTTITSSTTTAYTIPLTTTSEPRNHSRALTATSEPSTIVTSSLSTTLTSSASTQHNAIEAKTESTHESKLGKINSTTKTVLSLSDDTKVEDEGLFIPNKGKMIISTRRNDTSFSIIMQNCNTKIQHITSLPLPIKGHFVADSPQGLIVGGGYSHNEHHDAKTVYRYNKASEKWELFDSLNEYRTYSCVKFSDRKITVTGGTSGGEHPPCYTSSEQFDFDYPEKGWQLIPYAPIVSYCQPFVCKEPGLSIIEVAC